MEKKDINGLFWMLVFCGLFFLLGMVVTLYLISGFVSSFDGVFQNVNITVQINETRLVEAMNQSFVRAAVGGV